MSHSERIQEAAREIREAYSGPLSGIVDVEQTVAAIISKHIPEQNELLIEALIKQQQVAWKVAKEMRDSLSQLSERADSALAEMQALGMDSHLPTMKELLGMLNKSEDELAAINEAIRTRVINRSLATPSEPLGVTKEKK